MPHRRRKTYPKRDPRNLIRTVEAITQITLKSGPIYEKWKSRWEAATGLKLKEKKNAN